MQLIPELRPPRAPTLWPRGMQGDERPLADALSSNVKELETCCSEFSHALALYEFANAQFHEAYSPGNLKQVIEQVWSPWMKMATRYGGLTLRNWGQALAAAQGLIGRVPSWSHKIDGKGLKAVRKRFDELFPNIDKLRHSIAHPELYSNADKDMSAAGPIKTPGIDVDDKSRVTLRIQDRHTFVATFEGTVVQYDLSRETAEQLIQLTSDAFTCFSKVDDWPSR